MDQMAWSDRELRDWLSRKFVAIRLDVDADPTEAERLSLTTPPTLLALRDGVELDRLSGLRDALGVKQWLLGMVSDHPSLDQAREAASSGGVHAKMNLLRELTGRGSLEEATALAVWLWENMLRLEPGMIGVRHSFFVRDLKRLVAVHPAASDDLQRLRNAALATPSVNGVRDWVTLNSVLGDDDATLAWFAERLDRVSVEGPDFLRGVEHSVVSLLAERDRWSDVGRAILDPMASARRALVVRDAMAASPPPKGRASDHCLTVATRDFRDRIGLLVRGLVAAGREDDAQRVEDFARTTDDAPEMASTIATARSNARRHGSKSIL